MRSQSVSRCSSPRIISVTRFTSGETSSVSGNRRCLFNSAIGRWSRIIVALLTGRPGWTEVSYFWGIAGTFQAILTPNLQVDFPDIRSISFFVGHCGIVAGVIYLLIARRFRPTLGSVWRTLAWSQLYLVATLLVDHLTGVNYGFLLHKPVVASILDYLSDTRWLYIVELEGLALLFFAILYAPFALRGGRKKAAF